MEKISSREEEKKRREETVRIVRREDVEYPERLRALKGMPDRLYVKGSLPGEELTVAIVGARRCSLYGRRQAELFGRELALRGISVISGMASGVDGCAQKGALEAGGRSYAVLGCGADVCYPRENRFLYEALPSKGGILSEQPCGTPPLRSYFPARNRIISALADVVLVIEARKKSGSFITVDFALEQGKSVFALPGRVDDALSDGCNGLIAQGAGIALSPESILEELSALKAAGRLGKRKEMQAVQLALPEVGPEAVTAGLSPAALRLFKALDHDPARLDDLAERSRLSISEAACAVTELLLIGEAEEPFRNLYVRADKKQTAKWGEKKRKGS